MNSERESADGNINFLVESLYGDQSQKPRVSIAFRGVTVQGSPAKAVKLTPMLLDAAASSLQVGFIVA